jgi:predicted enzyme related to lactoylglutathione lyase
LINHIDDLADQTEPPMDYRLEVVQVPVTDVDRAKAFYTERAGFNADHDTTVSDEMRVVQLTPPGSGCSIVIGTGLTKMKPGSIEGLQLVVSDIEAARADLADRGVDVSDVQLLGPADMDGSKFVMFSDPDGNGWAVQEFRGG